MAKFQRHIFVCVNERPDSDPRGCCADKGARELAKLLKKKLYALGFKRIVRANSAGCLDQCARGAVMVVYPEGIWYGGVTETDLDEIIESHIVAGEVVERLVIPDNKLTGKAARDPEPRP